MAAVLIRNISEATHKGLKVRAKINGVSTEAEIRSILDSAVRAKKHEVGIGTQLQEWGRKYGPLPEIVRAKEPFEPANFD